MNWKVVIAKSLFGILVFAIVIGSSPMSHMFMQTMHMDMATTFQVISSHNDMQASANNNLAGSCCDAVNPPSVGCALLIPQLVCLAVRGESTQFSNSAPIVHLIYLESIAPPPKA